LIVQRGTSERPVNEHRHPAFSGEKFSIPSDVRVRKQITLELFQLEHHLLHLLPKLMHDRWEGVPNKEKRHHTPEPMYEC
jgi:hypothetical protein